MPRYNNLLDRKNEYRYKEIKNVLYLTTAAEYHDYKILQEWHDSEMKIPVPSVSDKPDSEIGKPILTHIITCRIDEIFKQICPVPNVLQ